MSKYEHWIVSEMEMSEKDWLQLNAGPGGLTIIKPLEKQDVIAVVWGDDDTEDKERAAFIVRAVNAHDELVEALTKARAVISLCKQGVAMSMDGYNEVQVAIRAALAKAEKEG